MRKVAVTGGLSSGKTTVCQFFKHLGAYVVSADEIVHRLLFNDSSTIQKIVDAFGPSILNDGLPDPKTLAAIVFSQPDQLSALEAILHPIVFNEIEYAYADAKQQQAPLFIAEVPLLYETGMENLFDTVITVYADSEIAKKRFIAKTTTPVEEFNRRMHRQLDITQKIKRADYAIHNNGSLQELETAVATLYPQLIRS